MLTVPRPFFNCFIEVTSRCYAQINTIFSRFAKLAKDKKPQFLQTPFCSTSSGTGCSSSDTKDKPFRTKVPARVSKGEKPRLKVVTKVGVTLNFI